VDNGSSDGSCDLLARRWSSVKVISFEKNCGFSAAVNAGITASGSEYIALVNNDVELGPEWLEHLVAALDADASAGSATGKLLTFHDRQLIASAGDVIARDATALARGRGELDAGQYDLAELVFSGTGGATLYRRSAFERVGLFDEDFFAYLEDIDWGFRAQLTGFLCWYIPEARSYHLGGVTVRKASGLLSFLLIRNTLWLALKNFPNQMLRRNLLRVLLVPTLRSYRTMRGGKFAPVFRAWLEAAAGIPKMLGKRRVIQSKRSVDVEYINALVGPAHLDFAKLRRLTAHLVLRARRFAAFGSE
jgi:GT2 family glycosyltransferase